MNEIIESAEYNKAVALHRRICVNVELVQQNLFDMCQALKEMRDGKLYKELGYTEFDDYCKENVGMSDRQAYKYIAVFEQMPEKISEPGSRISILYRLTTLEEKERQKIAETVDINTVSRRELESRIADLKKANDRLMSKVEETEKKAAASRKNEEAACGKLSVMRTDFEMEQQRSKQLEARLNAEAARSAELENKIEELETRPIEVAVENDSSAIEDIKKENEERLKELRNEHEHELEKLKAKYEGRIQEASGIKEEVIDTKAVFKAYLSIAVDASKRLIEFINNNPDELFISRTRSLFETIIKEVKT